jgi:hypothetical protein
MCSVLSPIISLTLGNAEDGIIQHSVEFEKPVVLTLFIQVAAGTSGQDIVIGFIDESNADMPRWVNIDRSATTVEPVGVGAFTITVEIYHFTNFAVLLDPLGEGDGVGGSSRTVMYILSAISIGVAVIVAILVIIVHELRRWRIRRLDNTRMSRLSRQMISSMSSETNEAAYVG